MISSYLINQIAIRNFVEFTLASIELNHIESGARIKQSRQHLFCTD